MKLINTTKLVRMILESMPATREDDCLLWLAVIQKVAEYNDMPDITRKQTISDFLARAKYSPFPHYETVSRARRKLQEQYPELRATEETQAARAELEERYREYARANLQL